MALRVTRLALCAQPETVVARRLRMPVHSPTEPATHKKYLYMSSSAAASSTGASVAKVDDDSSSQLRTLLDRPGRSFNFPLSHYSLPRVVAQNLTDENGRALRIPVRLHLSHRVLTYMRNKIWSLKLPDRASFSSEPVDVRILIPCFALCELRASVFIVPSPSSPPSPHPAIPGRASCPPPSMA